MNIVLPTHARRDARYGMRTLEAAQRSIGVVFVVAIAVMAVAWSEARPAIPLAAGVLLLALAHLGLTRRLRAVIHREREILSVGSEPRSRWDASWFILVVDAIVAVALIFAAVFAMG